MLREQVEVLGKDNAILKRAVAIQHERQKELDEKTQELQHLRQLVSQYQEQLRTLEVCTISFITLERLVLDETLSCLLFALMKNQSNLTSL